jgi:elongin-B
MIRRKKTTIFTDAKETTNVSELKKIIQGITTFLLDHLEAYQ